MKVSESNPHIYSHLEQNQPCTTGREDCLFNKWCWASWPHVANMNHIIPSSSQKVLLDRADTHTF